MKKLLTVLTIISFSFAWMSCSAPKGLKFQSAEGLSIKKDKKYPFLVYVKFYNPNKFPLTIKYGNMETFLEDLPMGEVTFDTTIKVAGKETFLLPLGYSPDYARMFPNHRELTQQMMNVKINGSVAVERKGKFYVTSVHSQGDLPQAQ